jgi:hypothetical protein
MKYIFTALLFTAVLFFACNQTKQTELFDIDNLKTEQFTVNTDRDTVLQTAKGAILKIPKGVLASADGKPVKLDIKEAYSMADIIKAGLTTTTNGQPLSSGGMIYINAADGQNVTINEGIQVAIPSTNISNEMKLYKGETTADGRLNWIDPTELPENSQIASINQGEGLFQKNCGSCHGIGTDFTAPDLAHFLNRFPDVDNETYWGFWAHGPYPVYSDSTSNISTELVKADTIKKNTDLHSEQYPEYRHNYAEEIYACNIWNWSSNAGQPFTISRDDLLSIYKYVQLESNRKNLPMPAHAYLDDCVDSCIIYAERTKFLRKAKNLTEEKRQKFIEENGDMTVVIPDPTWGQTNIPPPDYEKRVSPTNYEATYYQFTVETFGWYNIDALILPQFKGVEESELYARVTGEWKDRVNIFLIIPSVKVYGEGGPADRNPEEFAFFYKNGKLPLPQNAKAYILAVSEKDDKIAYGLKEFKTSLKQEIEIQLEESSKADFDKVIASLGATDLSFDVKPTINADSIRAADKQLKDIDKGLKDAEILNPKNCKCDCLADNMMMVNK